jgi:hypothetical protein
MSTNDNTQPFSGLGGEAVDDYEPLNQADGRVLVGEDLTRIPILGDCATVHLEKGVSDIQRYAQITTLAEYDGQPYWQLFQGGHTYVEISLRDWFSEEMIPVFRGTLTAWGAATEDTCLPILRLTVKDPSVFLESTPASARFANATVLDVLSYVADELESNNPIWDTVKVTGVSEAENKEIIDQVPSNDPLDNLIGLSQIFLDDTTELFSKNFTNNRNNLLDVLEWAKSRTGLWWQLVPANSKKLLLSVGEPRGETFVPRNEVPDIDGTVQAGGEDNDRKQIGILDNSVLYQTQPINTIVVRGAAERSRSDIPPVGDTNWRDDPPRVYQEVRASYPPLVERANGNYLTGRIRKSNAGTESILVEQARSALIDRLTDGDRTSTIRTVLAPGVKPFDRLEEVRPVDKSVTQESVVPLDYTVTGVSHYTPATEFSVTDVSVVPAVDPDEIEIETSWKEV